ncbi:MAG: hypothetical protein AAF443_04525 [Chlamydiota bacterium]
MKKVLLFFCLALGAALAVACFSIGKDHRGKKVNCTHIAQTGPEKAALPTDYLASFLGIPVGQPLVFAEFDLNAAEQRLLACPVIEKAAVTEEEKGVLLIDYTLRMPVAFLGDFSNCALDQKGHCFPFFPFFTPKTIPSFYFGLQTLPKTPLKGVEVDLAFAVLDTLEKLFPTRFPKVIAIDVSKVAQSYLGRREIVVTLTTRSGYLHYLRLTPERYFDELKRYASICSQWPGNLTFDLRVNQLAFIKSRA